MTRDSFDHDRLDSLFDGELSASEERELLSAARRIDGAFEELAKTRRAIELLHEPIDTPDMTQDILASVHARRAFLPPKWRRVVSTGRLAAAIVLLVCVGAVAMVQRNWPEATTWTPEPRPISAVVECGRSEASLGVRQLVDGLGGITVIAPVMHESPESNTLRLSDGLPVTFRLITPGERGLVAVGWTNAPAGEGGAPGVFYSGAMPFEVFDGSATFRALHASPALYPMGGWVVAEEFIVDEDDEPGSARD